MRKLLFYTTLSLLIILTGCSDFSSSGSNLSDKPVVLDTLERGEILKPGDSIEIEYTINESVEIINKLIITLTGPDAEIIEEIIIEEDPLIGWAAPLDFDDEAAEGSYSLRFDFYSEEEVFYSEYREFFIFSGVTSIISVASYPPVLYPGGGGLFHAETDSSGRNCWLRWSLDNEVIAEGLKDDGYGSIEIEAPDAEGVYSLSLEVFPEAPSDGQAWEFESPVKKEIPLYVNTEQKSGLNEFGFSEDYFSLFHFRGNLMNSADYGVSGIKKLTAVGQPALSVRNGMFGYHIDRDDGFEADAFGLPVENGVLKGCSVMISMIPLNLEAGTGEASELYYTALDDESLGLELGIYPDGRIEAKLFIEADVFSLVSSVPVLMNNIYSSIALAIQPTENELTMSLYADGEPVGDTSYYAADIPPSWLSVSVEEKSGAVRLGREVELLIDEMGIYHKKSVDGAVVDPNQFKRSMDLEYGKFLMFAEGFDGENSELIMNNPGITISDSNLILPPGAAVDFPPLYPGYEEVLFRIELGSDSVNGAEAVFFVDGGDPEIAVVDFTSAYKDGDTAEFSLIFSKDSVQVSSDDSKDGETAWVGDFSSVDYSIKNTNMQNYLVIRSILVIRKNIIVSEMSDISGKLLFFRQQETEDKINS